MKTSTLDLYDPTRYLQYVCTSPHTIDGLFVNSPNLVFRARLSSFAILMPTSGCPCGQCRKPKFGLPLRSMDQLLKGELLYVNAAYYELPNY